MTANNYPIGIFDSGVGGLSILQSIRKLLPNENLIYVADSAFVPYGEKSEAVIESRVMAIAELLAKKNIKALVVACNTATAAAINTLRNQYSFPIIGLEPALKSAAENTHNSKVGILATQATLDSQKYLALKERFASRLQLIEKASPLFVDLVENAPTLHDREMRLIEKELMPFKSAQIDSLVLGCTHYPFLTEAIASFMGPEVILYESGMPVALELQRRIQMYLNNSEQPAAVEYYSSNASRSQQAFDTILRKKVEINPF